MRFDDAWRERTELADGSWVRLRLLRPADRQLIRASWERLSPASRYRRFLAAKPGLSAAELAYLTEVDQLDHVALGAVRLGDGGEGEGEGLGVARCVRLVDRPDTAEASVVIVDDVQGRGLGRLLLARLIEAAQERGIERFAFELLISNLPMRALIQAHFPALIHGDEEVVALEVPLREARRATADVGEAGPTAGGPGGVLYRLLAAALRGGR